MSHHAGTRREKSTMLLVPRLSIVVKSIEASYLSHETFIGGNLANSQIKHRLDALVRIWPSCTGCIVLGLSHSAEGTWLSCMQL